MKPTVHLMTMSPAEHGGALSPSDALIWNELQERGVAGYCFMPDEVSVLFGEKESAISVQGQRLHRDDVLLVRLTRGATEKAYEVACAFSSLGGRVSDPVTTLSYAGSKMLGYTKRHGLIPQRSSLFFHARQSSFDDIASQIQPPFMIKPQYGARGEGVALIHSKAEFDTYVSQSSEVSLFAQDYIADIANEYRVVVVGGSVLGVVEKCKQDGPDRYLGANDTDVPVHDEEVAQIAISAARVGGGHVYGADIVRTTKNRVYLLENNRCPDFSSFRAATGLPVEKHIVDFLLQGEW